jgi:hypothetical protein
MRRSLRVALQKHGFESIDEQLEEPDQAGEEVDRFTWIGLKWAGRAKRRSQEQSKATKEASRWELESEQRRAHILELDGKLAVRLQDWIELCNQ